MQNSRTTNHTQLTLAVSHYWQAYGEYLDKPIEPFRKWTDYGEMFLKRIGEATHHLFHAMASTEGLLIKDASFRHPDSFLEVASPVFVSLGSISIGIYPLVKSGPADETAKSEFYTKLDPHLLNLVVLPYHPQVKDCEAAISMRAGGANIIVISPNDVDALGSALWTLKEMLQYKIFRVFLQGGVDADAVFTDWQVEKFRNEIASTRTTPQLLSLKRAIEERRENPRSWIRHPKFDNLLRALRNNPFVFMVGESASGKSTLALDLAMKQESLGFRVFYVNVATLTDQGLFQIGVTWFKKLLIANANTLLMLDDLHCRPEIGRNLLTYLGLFKGNGMHVLATCWPSYFEEFRKLANGEVVTIQAVELKNYLIAKFGGTLSMDLQKQALDFAGDDLLLLRLSLEFAKKRRLTKDYTDLAQEVWKQRSRGLRGDRVAKTRAMLVVSSLGQYECDLPEAFMQALGVSKDQLKELHRAKLLIRRGDRYSVPHRSFARILASYLGKQNNLWAWFQTRGGPGNLGELVLSYLQFLDPSEVWSVLELINKTGGIQLTTQSQKDAKFLIESWRAIDALLRKIYEQQTADPTWGYAISSATFAYEALGAIGKNNEARGSITFIRDVYHLDSNKLVIDVTKLSTVTDFTQIRSRMKAEEAVQSFVKTYSLETADTINIDLFHENWASGLVLCAESASQDLDREILQRLAEAVEAIVEEGEYFYPARVPWCTARVLMGLGRCGRNIENSDTVRRVANWLMKSRRNGGSRESSFWVSGTGTWNTPIEVTAMCIIALREVGVPADNPILIEAMDWLWQQKREWTKIGKELDGAVAIEAYLQMNKDWREIVPEVTWLTGWAVGQAVWMYAAESADKTMEQTCRVAQIATFLINAIWSILRSDLPGLLAALGLYGSERVIAMPKAYPRTIKEAYSETTIQTNSEAFSYDVALSYTGEDREYVRRVAECLRRAGVEIFYDQFEEVDLWGKDLSVRLDEVYRKQAKFCVVFVSDAYARKAWPSYERRSALARSFQENQEYILPVRMDDTDIPGISPLIAYIDGRKYTPSQLCKMILIKLRSVA